MGLRDVQRARDGRLAMLSSMPFPLLLSPSKDSFQYYKVDDIHFSENAVLLFCYNMAIKRLLAYKDQRYNQEIMRDRQQCLIEGLEWNRKFTSGVHIGLARIYDWRLKNREIGLGKELANPRLEDLDPEAEYVLVMRKLPKDYRLDRLLRTGTSISHQFNARLLSQQLAKIHENLENVTDNRNDGVVWGSPGQLKKKLECNLNIADKPEKVKRDVLQDANYKALQSLSNLLKDFLLPLFDQKEYADYFEQRVSERHIKRCHGDLKARNVWILPSEYAEEKHLQEGVNILDAIDFNPDYCNIDTLSDIAMLAVDLQVRTLSSQLANYMIEEYLTQTEQTDKVSRFVLQYYLVEKAFVGTIVSILYDDLPELGESYLQAALRNLADMRKLISARLI